MTGLVILVFFRRKEISIYPDDSDKPEVGQGLNRRAEVTLNGVWPTDKTTRLPIKSPERIKNMDWERTVETKTHNLPGGAKFLEYRPDDGAWVFSVSNEV